VTEQRSPRVTVFGADGCHLCERALEVVREAQAVAGFDVDVVDITGDETLETAYRTLVPVIEIDGVREFTYFVTVEALLDRIGEDGSPARRSTSAGSM
jgi:glutaredoxin